MSDTSPDRLTELEARYQGVIEAAVDGIVIIDARGIIEAFNPAAQAMFGYHADEVLGRNVNMLMPEPDASRHDSYIANFLAGGAPQIIGIGREVEGRRRNGEIFPMELAVGEVAALDPPHFVGTVRDITARRALETALQGREQELRVLLDNAPIGIFAATPDGRFMRTNPALRALLGYAEHEFERLSCRELTIEEERERLSASLAALRVGDKADCRCALRWRARDGATIDVELFAVLAESDREVIIGQVLDRTEQLRSERESRAAQARLAHVGRLTTMGEMASAMAHEINQPLGAISAYAQACRRLLDAPETDAAVVRDTLESIVGQAHRAGDVVRRIRGFVANRESERVVCDINAIVASVLELDEFDLRSNEVRVETELARELPAILADPIQIQQVLLNLLRNAIDAMAGVPAVSRYVRLKTGFEAGHVVLQCSDCGPGVEPAMRANLFEPFQTTKPDGMGMGLSISKSIVAAHDGTLSYCDNPDRGACFVIALPPAETAR